MFQTSSASILNLDSPIVQIDCFLKYLLVSTTTRTYLCDSEKEFFKPIGKKLRDGPFGACFFSKCYEVKHNKDTCKLDNTDSTKIYCARPGARLWEADFEASVVSTHQFRDSFVNKQPSEIVVVPNNVDAKLNIMCSSVPTSDFIPENFNFGKLFVIRDLILTFNRTGFYIFHPAVGSLTLWSNQYDSIKDIKVLNSSLYIWQGKQIVTLNIVNIEEITLQTLFRKQYYACSQLCIRYSDEVLKLIDKSSKIHLIRILRSKLSDSKDVDLLSQICPLLDKVEYLSDQLLTKNNANGGIKIVDNAHFVEDEPSIEDVIIPESILNFKSIIYVSEKIEEKINEGTKNVKEKLQVLESKVKKLTSDTKTKTTQIVNRDGENLRAQNNRIDNARNEPKTIKSDLLDNDHKFENNKSEENDPDNLDYRLKILLEQFKLNKIHKNVETSRISRLFKKLDLIPLRELFDIFIDHVKEVENADASLWCKEQYLKHLVKNKDYKQIDSLESSLIEYLITCFCDINLKESLRCTCGYPLPKARNHNPHYYKVGLALMDATADKVKICNSVPYMWKYYLNKLPEKEIFAFLPLMIQFSDTDLAAKYSKNFFFDSWDDALKYYLRLKSGVCLNCDNKIDNNGLMSWTDFGLVMLKSIGGTNTMKLLQLYAKYIPNRELGVDFYRACIFSTSLGGLENSFGNKPLDLFVTLNTKPHTKLEVRKSLEKFLSKKYLETAIDNKFMMPLVNCSFCDMPVNIQILEYKLLNCGHYFHDLCLFYNKRICIVCN